MALHQNSFVWRGVFFPWIYTDLHLCIWYLLWNAYKHAISKIQVQKYFHLKVTRVFVLLNLKWFMARPCLYNFTTHKALLHTAKSTNRDSNAFVFVFVFIIYLFIYLFYFIYFFSKLSIGGLQYIRKTWLDYKRNTGCSCRIKWQLKYAWKYSK